MILTGIESGTFRLRVQNVPGCAIRATFRVIFQSFYCVFHYVCTLVTWHYNLALHRQSASVGLRCFVNLIYKFWNNSALGTLNQDIPNEQLSVIHVVHVVNIYKLNFSL